MNARARWGPILRRPMLGPRPVRRPTGGERFRTPASGRRAGAVSRKEIRIRQAEPTAAELAGVPSHLREPRLTCPRCAQGHSGQPRRTSGIAGAALLLGAAWSFRGAAWSLRGWRFEEADQVANRVVTVEGVTKWKLVVDVVAVAASVADFRQIAGSLELVHDLCRGSFRDADGGGDVAQAQGGLSGDALEHVRMVGHEPPRMISLCGT